MRATGTSWLQPFPFLFRGRCCLSGLKRLNKRFFFPPEATLQNQSFCFPFLRWAAECISSASVNVSCFYKCLLDCPHSTSSPPASQQTPHQKPFCFQSFFSSLCTRGWSVCQAVSQATSHILTHLQYAFQFFSHSVRLRCLHRLFALFCMSLDESLAVAMRVQLMYFYLKHVCCCFFMGSRSAVVAARSLNRTLDIQSIECACICRCMDAWVCARVLFFFLLGCVRLCAFFPFLKRYVEVSEAHGSSCCVPSYFPASVSTWLCAGYSL